MVDSFALLAAKVETTYGTDATPTLTTDAILTRNLDWTPVEVDMIKRDLDYAARGATPGVPSNKRSMFSFECELQGSGTAGTAPAWMKLLQACGMAAPVIVASVSASVKMAAVGTALSSLSAYNWRGDQRRKALGARGDFSFDFSAGAFPFLGFDYIGLVPATTPFDVATPGAPTLTAWKDPIEVNTTNTVFTLDTYAAVLKSFKGKANADVKTRNLVGSNYVQRGNHDMSVSIVIEAPSVATKNYLTTLQAGSRIATQLIHGTVAGSIVQIDSANLQIEKIKESVEDDILMWTIDAKLTITGAGQDDILITAK